MNIGQAAEASGISAKTIRYYEDVGLIPSADRSRGGYRIYDKQAVHMLRFIHRSRELGFSMNDIRQLLTLWRDRQRASADVKQLAHAHMADLDRKLEKLHSMRQSLEYLIEHCEGDNRPDCPILDELSGRR